MSNNANVVRDNAYRNEPEWLLAWRKESEESIKTLPHNEKYGIGITALDCDEIPDCSSRAEYSVDASKGVELYTWNEAITQEEITPYIERLFASPLLPSAASPLSAIGRARFATGLVVYVQPTLDDSGRATEETLDLRTMVPLGSAADMLIVIAKEGSRFRFRSTISGGEGTSVMIRTVIVLSESDSSVKIESFIKGSSGFVSTDAYALVSAHATVDWTEDPESAHRVRSHTESRLIGESASSSILSILIGEGQAFYDVWASVWHGGDQTHSRIDALGLSADHAKLIYRSAIDMHEGVHAVRGSQEGKFLILSPDAEVDAIPALDIASNEVTSTHKLSVSHIRDIDLFYANTRGMSRPDARALALEGFFGSLLSIEGKEEIMNSVRERISHMTT